MTGRVPPPASACPRVIVPAFGVTEHAGGDTGPEGFCRRVARLFAERAPARMPTVLVETNS